MTATLIAILVERGQLSWTTPLSQLVPDAASAMRPEYRDVTLVDLLSHRSGLPEQTDVDFILRFYDDPPALREQRVAYTLRALQDAPAVQKRTSKHYSNSGFIIAASIAERITGRSFEDLIRSELFRPLGMNKVGFGATGTGQPLGHENGKPLQGKRADNPLMWSPAGGMHMPLQDWARFAIDQIEGYHGRGKVLKQSSYRFLMSPLDGSAVTPGWGVREPGKWPGPGPLLTHSGSNGYWDAMIAVAPETSGAILLVTNAGDSANAQAANAKVLRQLLPRIAGSKAR
jgi:CubicO group peptidase (beta-lactamase class C family)